MRSFFFICCVAAALACTNYSVTANSLNTRKGPSTKYNTAGILKKDAVVCVVSITNGWAKLNDNRYASAKYLSQVANKETNDAPPADAATEGACTNYKVTTLGLNLRSGPGTSYPASGFVSKDEVVCVVSITGIWAKLNNNKYCSTKFLEKVVETPNTPEKPDTPDTPDVPETPEKPDVPETPETPDVPETPDTPDVPDAPDAPDTPDTPNAPESSGCVKYTVTASSLNTRKGPNTTYDKAGTLANGASVCVSKIENGWALLDDGRYVSSKYLEIDNVVYPTYKGWNVEKAVKHLNSHAHGKSTGNCATYTKNAMAAGGIPYFKCDAYACAALMESKGFKVISDNKQLSSYLPGDIAIFDNNSAHAFGHMQMYNGKQWVSDFRQKLFSPYNSSTPDYKIYRFSDK